MTQIVFNRWDVFVEMDEPPVKTFLFKQQARNFVKEAQNEGTYNKTFTDCTCIYKPLLQIMPKKTIIDMYPVYFFCAALLIIAVSAGCSGRYYPQPPKYHGYQLSEEPSSSADRSPKTTDQSF